MDGDDLFQLNDAYFIWAYTSGVFSTSYTHINGNTYQQWSSIDNLKANGNAQTLNYYQALRGGDTKQRREFTAFWDDDLDQETDVLTQDAGGIIWLNPMMDDVVTGNDTSLVPGSAATLNHLVANGSTDSNGVFALLGKPSEPVNPGYGALVLQIFEKAYIGSQGISFTWRLNITDDANISLISPSPVEQPMLGVGVNSSVSGYLTLENSPSVDVSSIDKMLVILNYTTSVDGLSLIHI